jgi:hypothetical protein
MLPDPTVPASLLAVLGSLRGSFTSPTFSTFAALVTGLIANTGRGTVTGMLLGANLTRHWSHDRAHSFFARARGTRRRSARHCPTWWCARWCPTAPR